MKLLPPFEERSFPEQLIAAIVIPVVFGIITGLALGWNGVVYWILVGPIAVIGGFVGGMDHRGADDGFVRGVIGGLVYGSFVLIGFEIANTDPKAYLGEPHVGLVFDHADRRHRDLGAGPGAPPGPLRQPPAARSPRAGSVALRSGPP